MSIVRVHIPGTTQTAFDPHAWPYECRRDLCGMDAPVPLLTTTTDITYMSPAYMPPASRLEERDGWTPSPPTKGEPAVPTKDNLTDAFAKADPSYRTSNARSDEAK